MGKKLLDRIFLIITTSLLLIGFTSQGFAQVTETELVDPVVILETNLGNITIDFFHDDAPNHVLNFIKLSKSGYYDGTIFHRIIPDFMIQGGDPNTISGDSSTWGTGGPDERVDAEFNTIKHNRGIVSMARSTDPNSAGSQFFIVHKNSNFLDEQYTAFGRIVTEESYQTIDKIAAVQTNDRDAPIDAQQVKITKATVVNRSEVSNILELPEPERTQSVVTQPTGNQKYESTKHEVAFSVPEGWLLQEPDKTQDNAPDVAAIGPRVGVMNPVISLTISQTDQRTLDELISEKTEALKPLEEQGSLFIVSRELKSMGENHAYIITAEGYFSSNGEELDIKFKEVMIYDTEKYYTLAYSNGADDYDSQLPKFEETVNSFKILSKDSSIDETQPITSDNEENGGCLIATATFGSELAPQVQQLRELRDNTILSTKSGTAFMMGFNQIYYSFSPTIADLEREYPVFKEVVKLSITPMLSTLSILNYAEIDSEQEIISYGIGIILMNIGMYLVAPAIIIYKIRK